MYLVKILNQFFFLNTKDIYLSNVFWKKNFPESCPKTSGHISDKTNIGHYRHSPNTDGDLRSLWPPRTIMKYWVKYWVSVGTSLEIDQLITDNKIGHKLTTWKYWTSVSWGQWLWITENISPKNLWMDYGLFGQLIWETFNSSERLA